VAVGFDDTTNSQYTAQFEEALVLVGGVDEDAIAGFGAAHHEHVVVHGAHDDGVDLPTGLGKKQGHVESLAVRGVRCDDCTGIGINIRSQLRRTRGLLP
jgi:hypothetical protein